MKALKIITLLTFVLIVSSCKKEVIEEPICNCGTVVLKDCSDSLMKFCLPESDWQAADFCTQVCMFDQEPW